MKQQVRNVRAAPKHIKAYTPALWDMPELMAFQALQRGDATSQQMKIALTWLVNDAARTYDNAFQPGGAEGARDSDFLAGRQFVGQQVVKLLNLNPLAIKEKSQ